MIFKTSMTEVHPKQNNIFIEIEMEESRSQSRVVIHDQVFDSLQHQRYHKHKEAIERLRTFDKKSNSHYSMTIHRAESLDRAKRVREETHNRGFPRDIEYKNCMRRIQDIQNSYAKLPKISNIRLYQNKSILAEKQGRINRQNQAFQKKISQFETSKGKQRNFLTKDIQNYQKYRKISRRIKSHDKKAGIQGA